MAIEYEDILLKVGSTANLDGIKNATDALRNLNSVAGELGDLKSVAENINSFVASLKGVNSAIVREYKSLADSLSKIARHGNSAKRAMDKMKASMPNTSTGFVLVDTPQAEAVEQVGTSLATIGKQVRGTTSGFKRLGSAYENLYKLGSGSPIPLLTDGRTDNPYLETTYREIGEVEEAYDQAMERFNSFKALPQHVDLFTAEDEAKMVRMNRALEAMHNHIARDRGIAERHGDTGFMAQIDEYANKLDLVESMLNKTTEGAFKNGFEDTYKSVIGLVREYGTVSKAHGTALASDAKATETLTMSLGDLNKVLGEIQAKGGISGALKANKTTSFGGILDSMNAQAQKAKEALDKVKEYLVNNPNVANNDSFLTRFKKFDPTLIKQAREELAQAGIEVGDFKKGLDDAGGSARGVANNVKKIGQEAKRTKTPLQKLADRFKSLLMYRALRFVITATVNAMKEGIKNLEAWDRRVGNTGFADAMDRARESLLVLKNSLAVVSAPFIEVLIRGLQQIASWAMTAANAISRFFAILGGQSTYRAVKWADYTANAVKATTGAVKNAGKEFERQLMKFDEINNITEKKGSGGSSGYGNSGYFNYDDMFEERDVGEVSEVEKKLKAIWDWIKKCAEGLKEALTPLLKIKDTIARVVEHTGEFLGKLSVLKKPLDTIWQGVLNVVNAVAGFTSAIIDFAGEIIILFEDTLGIVIEIGDELELWQKMADDAKWKLDLVADVINALRVATEQATAVVEFLGITMGNLWEVIKGKQSLTEFKQNTADAFQAMQTKIQEAADSFESKIGGTFSKRRAINFDTQGSVTPVEKAVEAAKRALNALNGYKPHINIDVTENVTRYVKEFTYKTGKFAEGGYPETGQMFVAREAGPELVGTIGGQTAVVNNSDIVASVSQGVAQAVASVLGGGQQVNVTLEGDAKNLFKVVQREGRAYSARTGQPALA